MNLKADQPLLRERISNHAVRSALIPFGIFINHSHEGHALAFRCGVGNKHISNIELGKSKPSLESLVQIANFLNVSADDLLVDSLAHSASTADSEIHRLLLDCNTLEQEILTRMVKELKAILYGLGV